MALNAAGMVRAGLTKGNSGVQTVYDVFLLAPLGIGVADQSAGGSLVVVYLTSREIKNCLEFMLIGNPNLPGQYFPRVSGMRFRYDLSRPKFDAVTQIELGDLARGYRTIDTSDKSTNLYSVACNLYFGLVLISVSRKAGVSLVPKKRTGHRSNRAPRHYPKRHKAGRICSPRKEASRRIRRCVVVLEPMPQWRSKNGRRSWNI